MSTGPVSEAEVLTYLAATTTAMPDLAKTSPNLREAAEVYRAAGSAALAEQDHDIWLQYRLQPADWATAENRAADQLAPTLDQLCADGTLSCWWYLRKYPFWRLRALPGPAATRHQANRQLTHLLDFADNSGSLTRWTTGRYEPEVIAFGGETMLEPVHAFFHADSSAVVALVRSGTPAGMPGRRELSLVLCSAMLRSARLDPLERADVWNRVALQRSLATEPNPNQLARIADRLQRLTRLDTTSAPGSLFADGQQLDALAPWAAAYRNIGHHLAKADENGTLHRGLREILATLVLHAWNRLDLPDSVQGLLARAACQAAKIGPLPNSTPPERTPAC